MSKKKAKLKLVFKTQPFLVQGMEREEFEELVEHHYKVNYNFRQSFKRRLITEHLFYASVDEQDEDTLECISEFKRGKTELLHPLIILCDLANNKLIEEGYYLITDSEDE